jgi:hypothetical protein
VTATPPAGTVSATVTLSGAGGGGGGTDSNTSNGGAGGQVTGTFALTHNTGQVAVELGGGGGAGNSCSSDFLGRVRLRGRRWRRSIVIRNGVRSGRGLGGRRRSGIRSLPGLEQLGNVGGGGRRWRRRRRRVGL